MPLPSTAVTVTLFTPRFAQSNVDLLKVKAGAPQLSVAVAKPTGMEALPAAFNGKLNVVLVKEIVGLMTSTTNTFLTVVVVLPLASVAVMVTGTLPLPLQLTTEGVYVTAIALEAVQLSVAEAITSDKRMFTLPAAESCLVTAAATTLITGAVTS